jgi:hypothetical protein
MNRSLAHQEVSFDMVRKVDKPSVLDRLVCKHDQLLRLPGGCRTAVAFTEPELRCLIRAVEVAGSEDTVDRRIARLTRRQLAC